MKNISKEHAEIFEFYLNKKTLKRLSFAHDAVYGKNFFFRLRKVLESLFGNLLKRWKYKFKTAPDLIGERWVVVGTRNQETSLQFLFNQEKYHLVRANFYHSLVDGSAVNWYPRPKLYFLFNYIGLLFTLFRADPQHFFKVFHHIGHGIGLLENHREVLKAYKPELIVLSNDLLPWFRALSVAARELSIPTVYIQHACVSDIFPPLCNDLNLLDGQDALDKYATPGKTISGRVALIGMAKYDQYQKLKNMSSTVKRISIAYNQIDSLSEIKDLINLITTTFPELELTLRKHPRDNRSLTHSHKKHIRWSDAREVSALEYLRSQDVIIAGESSIHLEAALMNVTSIQYDLSARPGGPVDYYGFIANGLIEHAHSKVELIRIIKEQQKFRTPLVEKLDYYVFRSAKKTSSEIALEEIENLMKEANRSSLNNISAPQ